MAEVIRMPKMSDTMEEGVIAEWHKKVGDKIKSGEIIAEVETDKATMDLESYYDGTLLYIGVNKGDAVPIDGIMAVVGAEGEDYKSLLEGGSTNGAAKAETSAEPAKEESKPAAAVETVTPEPAKKPVAAAPAEKINAVVVRMPKMSDTMEEGTLVGWQKKVGDKVKSGDILAEVETDKATMELEAYEDGTLLYIGIKDGESVPVDGIIAVIGEEGANVEALLARENGEGGAEVENIDATDEGKAAPAAESGSNGADKTVSVADSGDRIKASPLAKRLADEKGIDLSQVGGSGDNGRIVKRDVDEFKPAAAAAAAKTEAAPAQAASAPAAAAKAEQPAPATGGSSAPGDFTDLPISQMRKTIARRLSDSLFTAPHFYVTMEINMDKAMALRPQLNEVSPAKISFNDMVIKACAVALKQHPAVNSAWLGDKIRKYNYVNIGVAVAVDEGLLVPVIRDADKKTLSTISGEVKDLAGKAKDKKLQPKDWEGNTFSISNLGMFGVDEFTAIINPPDSCILAIGAIKKVAAFKEDGTVYPQNIMKVTLSADHRVVDGALGAQFLLTVKKLLEEPMSMLV
ncbi:pyruvate dehydrogenase complex dihydrolipoamide acetyltransferase [Dyadobacter chenwenxiniae]|uniref:Acetyltransferase component of pyruvate dehydrogenase complex n=1 Tax=Dyadobacter chenwenxiniae TaxID=2906456 RepID=A0A9X1TCQ7_9BACT|nr:pyruvate dehydrogenase complex dihydrolipoamide acetyltransferase [Dyadobacter chenwenxiniae]MCF0060357.1 pyruvate dehydrogenase complex dihydrolipoamide acetyltransferase [Dyadobacter chenwenxiniae]UON86090.1 pyruvate dehydrogenase complex dihydrolipoamide acetyltransferase [Dyadobacter chenwenxiniae]